jgi:hypothetical protein
MAQAPAKQSKPERKTTIDRSRWQEGMISKAPPQLPNEGYVEKTRQGTFSDIYPTSIRLALEDKIDKTKSIADKFDRWVLVLVDEILPTMMGPSDLGPLHMNLGHFRGVVIIKPDASLALE